jgi:hypothetical protein
MMLAESIASNINWTLICTILMAIATFGMWLDAKKARVTQIEQPLNVTGTPLGNAEIQRDLKAMNHRLVALEQWRGQLINKLDSDKTEVIEAGEDRARRIYDHVDQVRRELDRKITDIPGEVVALLKNTGAI